MQISANTAVKVIEGHTKAIITKPQNVMVMRDIQCDGYVTGSDVTWFGDISAADTEAARATTQWIDWGLEKDQDRTTEFAQYVKEDRGASKVTVTDGGPPFYPPPFSFPGEKWTLWTCEQLHLLLGRGRGSWPLSAQYVTSLAAPQPVKLTLGSFGEPARWRFARQPAFVGCLLCLHASASGDSETFNLIQWFRKSKAYCIRRRTRAK